MPYPDTTRVVLAGIENVERVEAATLYFMHTMNEPAHTLQNGLIIPQENTNTRTRDHGQARGRRSSSIRIQAYIRLNEVGVWFKSLIGAQTSSAFGNTSSQVVTITGTPTGGTFTLTYGDQTTAPIAYNAAAAAVEAALEALSNLGPSDVTVTGSAGGPYTVTFPTLPDPGYPNGIIAPFQLTSSGALLTGGTNPAVVITNTASVANAYRHRWLGGVQRGLPLSLKFYNGLYWRRMLGCRMNTANVQFMGDGLCMIDMELIGPASVKISTPTIPAESDAYQILDAPMQSVVVDGVLEADADRMAFNISNNLTQRSVMDGSTSAGRTRYGDFTVEVDGMVDYPDYAGSLYEAFENNTSIGSLELVAVDDLHTVGTVTPFNPYIVLRLPTPVLSDMTEGDDGGELVQMVKGRGQYDPVEAATIIIDIVNGLPGTYYNPT